MNKAIWKFHIETSTTNIVSMPVGAEILSVDSQGSNIVVYALVDTGEATTQDIDIKTYGTGHTNIDMNIKDYKFLGTVKLHNGALMFHVFYKKIV